MRIPHITLVVILFISKTQAKPTPQDENQGPPPPGSVADDYSKMMEQRNKNLMGGDVLGDDIFFRTVEGSSEGSGENSEEEGSGFFKNLEHEDELKREEDPALFRPRNHEGSEEGSVEFIEGEMGSGVDSQVIVKLAEEEEMTTESEMFVKNLVPRFDLEIGSGDGEELLKISSEEETSGDGIIIKIMTEEVGEGSGAEFRFAEISDEIG